MCSAATAEYCGTNKGVCIGGVEINSLAFVDDMLDVSRGVEDTDRAHQNAIGFSCMKKMSYSSSKCNTMRVNAKKKDTEATLQIKGEKLNNVASVKYIGDPFNSKGDNKDLIQDRIARGTSAMISIEAMMMDLQLGTQSISVHLLLYRSLILSVMLFNSQAWDNLSKHDIDQLITLQLKVIKKIVGASRTTSNAFTFLELGVLPLNYEIDKRRLAFLHHILNLEEEDPVAKLYVNQTQLSGEKNWANEIKILRQKYEIPESDDQIKELSKEAFKSKVNKAVINYAFNQLKEECKGKSKTCNINYDEFKTQDYLTKLYPWQAELVFRCRSKTADIKEHRRYQYSDNICRWCNLKVEDILHVINCGEEDEVEMINLDDIGTLDVQTTTKITAMTYRIAQFIDRVDY